MAAKVLTSTKGLDRATWLRWRQQGIGGSDIAAIAGLSPWRTALDVFLEKIGTAPVMEESEAMEWGTRLEAAVAQKFQDAHPELAVRRRHVIFHHPHYPWALANIDRQIYRAEPGLGILEVKTTGAWNAKSWETDHPSDAYTCQLQWYLGITGARWGAFAALIGGQHYREVWVEADPEVFAYLVQIGAHFWDQVQRRVPPVLDGSEASTELVKRLYPVSRPGLGVALPPDAAELIAQWQRAKAAEATATAQRQEAENRLKALLGDAECGRWAAGDVAYTVEWKGYETTRLDSKRLKADHPDWAAAYSQTTTSRRFAVKEVQG